MENKSDSQKSAENTVETQLEGETQESAANASKAPADDQIKKAQDELAEAKDKYLRLYAEFENHRRRTAKEKLDMIQSANEQLIKALLPVVDDFERAEKASAEATEKGSEGFLLIQAKLKKVLDQFGVKAMEVKGDFNPDFHEAITQVPVPDESMKGKIVDVVEKGYMLGDKVIRFAKVVVGQ